MVDRRSSNFFTLVVAEDSIPLITMAMSFMDANLRFHSAQTFDEAMEELKTHPFNAVIIDISADSSNVEYTRQLRTLHGAASSLPKIVIHSAETKAVYDSVKGDGVWRSVAAPFDAEKVFRALGEFCPEAKNINIVKAPEQKQSKSS